jgi:hypothetical protein
MERERKADCDGEDSSAPALAGRAPVRLVDKGKREEGELHS